MKISGFAHKPGQTSALRNGQTWPNPALSWFLLVSSGGSNSGLVQGWQQSFNPDEHLSPVVHKLKLLEISPRNSLVGGAGWTFF